MSEPRRTRYLAISATTSRLNSRSRWAVATLTTDATRPCSGRITSVADRRCLGGLGLQRVPRRRTSKASARTLPSPRASRSASSPTPTTASTQATRRASRAVGSIRAEFRRPPRIPTMTASAAMTKSTTTSPSSLKRLRPRRSGTRLRCSIAGSTPRSPSSIRLQGCTDPGIGRSRRQRRRDLRRDDHQCRKGAYPRRRVGRKRSARWRPCGHTAQPWLVGRLPQRQVPEVPDRRPLQSDDGTQAPLPRRDG